MTRTLPDLPALTLPHMLREQARRMPGRVAVRQKDFGIWNPVTWADYYDRARRFGLGLKALGLSEGGHVGVLSENRLEWVLAQLGAGIVRAVTVGVYPTSPANEVGYVLGHADAEFVVCEDQEQTDKVLERLAELPKLKRIIVADMRGLRGYARDVLLSFAEVEAAGRDFEAAHPGFADACLDAQRLGDLALLIYTSGSTGKPKGAMISYRNIRAEAAGLIERLELTPSPRTCPICRSAMSPSRCSRPWPRSISARR